MRIREYNASLDKRAELLVYYTEKQNSDMETKKETKKNTRLLSLVPFGDSICFLLWVSPVGSRLECLAPDGGGRCHSGAHAARPVGRVYPTRYDIPLVLVYRRYIFPVFIGQAKGERIERQTYLPEGFPPGCHPRFAGILV